MSCGNSRDAIDASSYPFGVLQGPYSCRSNGCRFSMDAIIDLVRQGYTQADIERLQGAYGTDALANPIRPAVPRTVDVQIPAYGSDLTRNQERIAALRAERDAYIVYIRQERDSMGGIDPDGVAANVATAQSRIDAIDKEIYALQNATSTLTLNGLDLTVNSDSSGVDNNALNCFVDVQYHISLTMLSQEQALAYQTGRPNGPTMNIDLTTMKSLNRRDRSITLASTGDVLTNNDQSRNYYNISSMVVKNLTEPTTNNPLVSTMLSMKMQIVEPAGFKLHEDIRDTAIKLGYVDINPGRILYRVDIYFSGYDQDSGAWTERIDIGNGRNVQSVSAIMSMSAMQAQVTTSGTVYDVDLVPAGHHAYRPEDFILDANTMRSGTTFRDFLNNFSISLKTAKENRTQQQVIRNYEFFAPEALMSSNFDVDQFFNENKYLFADQDPDHVIISGKDVDILTMLEGAMKNCLFVQQLFINDENNEAFNRPRVIFTVRFNTIYGTPNGAINVDPQLNDYKEITHQYIIEPFVTFKHGPVTKETLPVYVHPTSQMARIREIIRMGMLRRIYNYIYTAENTEVIEFDVKLRTFYYQSLNTSAMNGASFGRQSYGGSADQAIEGASTLNDIFRVISTNGGGESVDSIIQRLFGNSTVDVTGGLAGPVREGAARLGGGFNESPDRNFYGDVVSPPPGRRNDYELYMQDYLSLDLLKLEGMVVRGDPVWLLSPYATVDVVGLEKLTSTTEGTASSQPSAVSYVQPRGGSIIFLKIRPPVQTDYMNPNRGSASSYPNIIGGFYQITSVTSTFKDGRFTQSLDGIKLNHLNYAEELLDRSVNSGATSTSGIREPFQDLVGRLPNLLAGL